MKFILLTLYLFSIFYVANGLYYAEVFLSVDSSNVTYSERFAVGNVLFSKAEFCSGYGLICYASSGSIVEEDYYHNISSVDAVIGMKTNNISDFTICMHKFIGLSPLNKHLMNIAKFNVIDDDVNPNQTCSHLQASSSRYIGCAHDCIDTQMETLNSTVSTTSTAAISNPGLKLFVLTFLFSLYYIL